MLKAEPDHVLTAAAAFQLIRTKHWIKNLVVLVPLAMVERAPDPAQWASLACAALLFCLAASTNYVMNDILDREKDRAHPVKRLRPIASGRVDVPTAWTLFVVLLAVFLILLAAAGLPQTYPALIYLASSLLYSLWLKHVPFVEVLVIASGFLLRMTAGIVALDVTVSPWLLACLYSLFLFLGFAKRKSELATTGTRATEHRPVLRFYSLALLDVLLYLTSGGVIVAYSVFIAYAHGSAAAPGAPLLWTQPFVVFGVLRYIHLTHQHGGAGNPVTVALADRPIQVNVMLWAGSFLMLSTPGGY